MGIDQEKYRQMSVDGKWIAIAIEVVRDNPGMTRSELIAEASVFMPTFIVMDGKKRTKISLAMRAATHCSFKTAVVEQDGRHMQNLNIASEGSRLRLLNTQKSMARFRMRTFLRSRIFVRLHLNNAN